MQVIVENLYPIQSVSRRFPVQSVWCSFVFCLNFNLNFCLWTYLNVFEKGALPSVVKRSKLGWWELILCSLLWYPCQVKLRILELITWLKKILILAFSEEKKRLRCLVWVRQYYIIINSRMIAGMMLIDDSQIIIVSFEWHTLLHRFDVIRVFSAYLLKKGVLCSSWLSLVPAILLIDSYGGRIYILCTCWYCCK